MSTTNKRKKQRKVEIIIPRITNGREWCISRSGRTKEVLDQKAGTKDSSITKKEKGRENLYLLIRQSKTKIRLSYNTGSVGKVSYSKNNFFLKTVIHETVKINKKNWLIKRHLATSHKTQVEEQIWTIKNTVCYTWLHLRRRKGSYVDFFLIINRIQSL